MGIVCFMDTEFNALDYFKQNDGIQEITEIGAVIFENGKVKERFVRYCKLKDGHKITKRSKKCTGITDETLKEKGVPFNQAAEEFCDFIEKNGVQQVFAFGPTDAVEMRNTAKLNGSNKRIYTMIKGIKNIYPTFRTGLSLNYSFSLSDICRVCNVEHGDRAHDAAYDAEDTGRAFYNMKSKKIDKKILGEIKKHKQNVSVYRRSRNVKNINFSKIEEDGIDEFLNMIEKIFKKRTGEIESPVLTALHDDIVRLVGRHDLEKGESSV